MVIIEFFLFMSAFAAGGFAGVYAERHKNKLMNIKKAAEKEFSGK